MFLPAPLWSLLLRHRVARPRFSSAAARKSKQDKTSQTKISRAAAAAAAAYPYPLQQVSGLLREVGRQTEFTLQDLVDGLFPVLACERWLQTEQ